MSNLKIRLVQKKDLTILAKVYVKTYDSLNVEEHWTTKTAYKLLEWWFKKQPDLCFLAEYDNKIVGGFFTGIKPWWDGNHLSDGEIFVHPNYQKKGIGGALSKKVYSTAIKEYNAIRFDAFTFKLTKHPLEWYKSIGFEEISEWTMISGELKKVIKKL